MAKEFPIKIGLEIHGYLNTKEKLFCKCLTSGGDVLSESPGLSGNPKSDKINSRICPICTGQPGSKPMLANSEAMKQVLKIGLVLGCRINHDKKLIWNRKHYDWPDLPKGYQSTLSGAYAVPVGEKGKFKGIKITEIHLEEDPSQWNPETGKINYNRSGLPLIEIVTEPEFSNAEDVIFWLKSLMHSLSYIKAIRKDLGIKADVNVSTYGERVEIKNLHSIADIKKAIDYEVERQIDNYRKGIMQTRETLAYDSSKGITIKMREKESGEDYRFIPEPDLPVIKLDKKEIFRIEKELPEMPDVKLKKLIKEYKIDKKNAEILAKNLDLVEFVEKLSETGIDVSKNISWITIELLRVLNWNKKTLDEVDVKPEHIADLIRAVAECKITPLKAKQVVNEFIPKSFSISKILEKHRMISEEETKKYCEEAIKKNMKAVNDFRAGEDKAINFIIGEVMRLSGKRADYASVKDIVLKMLGEWQG